MKKYIPLILSLIILAAPLFYVVYCISKSSLIAENLLYTQLAVFCVSLIVVLIKRIHYVIRIVFSSAALIFAFGFTAFFLIAGGGNEFRVYEGNEDTVSIYDMNADDFGEYSSAEVYEYEEYSLFPYNVYTLILKYDENSFVRAENAIRENNSFYHETGMYSEAKPEFRHSNFEFFVRHSENKVFPKVIYFIGFNPQDNEIAYIAFNDLELDGVSSFENLLLYRCQWNTVCEYRNPLTIGDRIRKFIIDLSQKDSNADMPG